MADKEVNIDIKVKGVRELRKEMKDLESALLNATDPEQIVKLSEELGEIKDQFADINEQAAIFATGNKYERVSNSLGQIGDALLTLDFEKAEARAGSFAKAASAITFKDAIGSFKNLFKTITTMGKALLTNPFFLIGSIIAVAVMAIVDLLDELGLLEKMFEALSWPLNKLIEGMKALGSLLGFDMRSTEELEEIQKRQAEARVQQLERIKAAGQKVIDNIDFEIQKAQAAGKSTVELERQKQEAIRRTAEEQGAYLKVLILTGGATEEQKKQFEEIEQQWIKAGQTLELLTIKQNKAATDAAKKRTEDNKKIESDFNKSILTLTRQLEDEKIKAKEDGLNKELEIIQTRLKRQLEDLESTAYNEEQKALIRQQYRDIALEQEEAARQKQDQVNETATIDAQKRLNDMLLSLNKDRYEVEQINADNERMARNEQLKADLENGLITQQQYDDAKLLSEQTYADKVKQIEADKQAEIQRLEDETAQKRRDNMSTSLDIASQGISAIGNLMQVSMDAEIAKAEGNEKKQEALRKKAFKQQKALQIASAVMGMAQGIISGLGAPFPMNIAMPILAGITGAANIAKISSTKYSGNSSSGGSSASAATPSMPNIQTQRTSPNVNFTGGNDANTINMGGNDNDKQQVSVNVNASISADQMSDVQDKNKNLAAIGQL